MPTALRAVPLALAGVLLLAACGTESAGAGAGAGAGGPVSAGKICPSDPQYGDLSGAGRATADAGRPSGTPSPLPVTPSEDGEVRITGLYAWGPDSGCGADWSADYEITNDRAGAVSYTITFSLTSSSGSAVDSARRTVDSVGPGETVKGTVVMGSSTGSSAGVSGVKVLKVRSVPDDEAPTASGTCPKSGVHVYADEGDAAMGLRVVGLHLVNCGTGTYELNGFPEVEPLDEDHEAVEEVKVLQGASTISTGLGDDTARPLTLAPGEAALARLAWRNTTEFGDPVNAPYARIVAKPGADPVTVIPELDLGTTGKLGVGPWTKDTTRTP
ncbi:DUF4232 domain-containing protein [Streptomyces sp. NPDC058867]|uniref:DUF4232 domain-containing protein n=1 Tax=unclassified Streptomyces TaxID=2593676 RepID=UPI0036A01628